MSAAKNKYKSPSWHLQWKRQDSISESHNVPVIKAKGKKCRDRRYEMYMEGNGKICVCPQCSRSSQVAAAGWWRYLGEAGVEGVRGGEVGWGGAGGIR